MAGTFPAKASRVPAFAGAVWIEKRSLINLPSVSKKQARTMAAAAHNSKFAKKVGIPPSVAKEFNAADAGTGILKGKKSK